MTAAAPANTPSVSESTATETSTNALFGRFDLLFPAPCFGVGEAFFVRDRFPPTSRGNDRRTVINFINSTEADPIQTKLFQAAARAVIDLDHPGIIRAYEAAEVDGISYCLSEWPAQYETLASLISRSGWLDIERGPAGDILCQLLDALTHAHSRGIFHLSLSPETVLLEPNGHVLVAGFGLTAQDASDAQGALLTELASHLQPAYVSPEQLRGGPVSFHSDLYSLGIVMYEMLTDRIPSIKSGGLRRWGAYPAMPPNLLVPSLPQAVSNTTLMLLADDPADRYLSVDELRTLLGSRGEPPPNDSDQPGAPESFSVSAQLADLLSIEAPSTDDAVHLRDASGMDLIGTDSRGFGSHDIDSPGADWCGVSASESLNPDPESMRESRAPWIEPQYTGEILELGDLASVTSSAEIEPSTVSPDIPGSAVIKPEAKEPSPESPQVAEPLKKDTYEPPLITQVNKPKRSTPIRRSPESEPLPDRHGEQDLPDRPTHDHLPGDPGKEDLPEPPGHEDFPGRSRPEPLHTISQTQSAVGSSVFAEVPLPAAKPRSHNSRREPAIDFRDFLPATRGSHSFDVHGRNPRYPARPVVFASPKFSLIGQRSAFQRTGVFIFALALLIGAGYIGFAIWGSAEAPAGGASPAASNTASNTASTPVSNSVSSTIGSSETAASSSSSRGAAASPQVLTPEPSSSTAPTTLPQPASPAPAASQANVKHSNPDYRSRHHSWRYDQYRYSPHHRSGRRRYAYEQDQPLLPPKRLTPNFN
jgi:serine/threonine protein kinase